MACFLNRLKDINIPLKPTIQRKHRVQNISFIFVEADPIIWEDRIGSVELPRILDNYHIYSLLFEWRSKLVKLVLSTKVDAMNLRLLVFGLEVVIGQSHLVGAKFKRADHDDSVRELLAWLGRLYLILLNHTNIHPTTFKNES